MPKIIIEVSPTLKRAVRQWAAEENKTIKELITKLIKETLKIRPEGQGDGK